MWHMASLAKTILPSERTTMPSLLSSTTLRYSSSARYFSTACLIRFERT